MSIKSLFEDIADAIREKSGSSDTYTPAEMPSAIRSIPSGSSSASGVTYDNTTSGLSATNVQDAIDEVVGDVTTINSDLSELKIHGFGARVTLTVNTDYTCPSDGYLTVQCTSEVGACTTGWINGTDMIIVKSSNGDNYSSKSSTFVRKGSVIKFTKPGSVGASYGYFWPLENQA